MTEEEQRQFHWELLHRALDELLADYLIDHPQSRPSTITVLELLEWSRQQTIQPAS
jgi:hypothetical protein